MCSVIIGKSKKYNNNDSDNKINKPSIYFLIGGDSVDNIRKKTGVHCELNGSILDRDQDEVEILLYGIEENIELAEKMLKEIINHHTAEDDFEFKLNSISIE